MQRHTVTLPKNPKRMTMVHGEEALRQMGFRLGLVRNEMHEGLYVTIYTVTDAQGQTVTYSAKALRDLIYSCKS